MGELSHCHRTGLVSGVEQVLSPNHDERPANTEIDVIIIHAISLPPDRFGGPHIHDFFTNQLQTGYHPYFQEIRDIRVSSHFVIARTGQITQFVPTNLRAWHAGDSEFKGREKVNDCSMGIELEGCDTMEFEDQQYSSLGQLVRCLRQAYPKISLENIVGHSDVAPGRKTDPGPCFSWQRFMRELD
jgi:AmpD protein